MATNETTELLSPEEVLEMLKCSRSTLYSLMAAGFPKPLKLSSRKNRWRRCEIEDWLNQRPRAQIKVDNEPGSVRKHKRSATCRAKGKPKNS